VAGGRDRSAGARSETGAGAESVALARVLGLLWDGTRGPISYTSTPPTPLALSKSLMTWSGLRSGCRLCRGTTEGCPTRALRRTARKL
jgi:hypothetical protein